MHIKKKKTHHKQNNSEQTIALLNKTVSHSFLKRTRVKIFAVEGKIKKFYRDYRLPSIASLVFLLLILSLTIIRQLEQTSLLALRNEVTEGGAGYSLLISSDESDEFSRGSTEEDTDNLSGQQTTISNSNSTQSTSNSFTITNSTDLSAPSSGGDSSSAGSNTNDDSSAGGSTGEDVTPIPVVPFTAKIDSFSQGLVSLQCSNSSKRNKGTCSKVYSFKSGVRTENGPGTVSYSWQSNVEPGNGNGSFLAGAGVSITTVNKEVSLSCTKSSSFTIQFVVLSPTFSNSSPISVNHNCNEL